MKKLLILLLFSTLSYAQSLQVEEPPIPDDIERLIDRVTRPKPQEFNQRERLCMALNVWHEARSEPVEGQIAVMQVTLNRQQNHRFPDTICQVVYQDNIITTSRKKKIRVCQFTWTCLGVKYPKTNDPRWIRTQELVDEFFNGSYKHIAYKFNTSYNYHAQYVNPRWNLKRLVQIGLHIFYH